MAGWNTTVVGWNPTGTLVPFGEHIHDVCGNTPKTNTYGDKVE